ncbi:MAG: Alpha-glucosidase (EC [uncultured Thiotrichaceae bacterium]|uniref:Alpha-glucosidase (EC) n=1 Tax=uncultured Thiotrichaceae bacterium TaxID=298394 RepID=A0A6S6TFK3_9GAMM|nr:MAG: Alpha-glucosidase (EC [uncultured Thiotrichaceae bacterium]
MNNEKGCLNLEIIGEELFRARYKKSPQCKFPASFQKSAYVEAKEYPSTHVASGKEGDDRVLETRSMKVNVNAETFCIDINSKSHKKKASRLCPGRDLDDWLSVKIDRENVSQLYGLGQQHPHSDNPNGDWFKHGKRSAGSQYGNQMVHTDGGLIGNTQFPILYGLGDRIMPWFLFVDNYYPQYWDFEKSPMSLRISAADEVVFYFQMGESLAGLRRKYMDLVGKPLVPSRKYFGLWVSEYGFDNWQELDGIKKSLIENKFPLDGFVMDLQWFGGIEEGSEYSSMGKLTWDDKQFPNAALKIRALKDEHLGLMLIEESYINRGLKEHADLHGKGYLVKTTEGSPVFLDQSPWWGKGGMVDWTNPAAGAFWHDEKRQSLIDMGIMGHWTDLGEPMAFDDVNGVYHGFTSGKNKHADIHNLYNLLWHRSIYEGYRRHNNETRPFILSRSGGPGMQRYGAGMWSGDIPAKYENIGAHLNAHMHMVLSGIDYFSSDAGGFYRHSFPLPQEKYDELYTRWYAISALIDFPLRPHADNLCNCFHTSPDKAGDKASNLANTRLRYELIPYYYSLAHRANRHGEPVVAPALYADDQDFELVGMASQKMIGPWLMAALESRQDKKETQVYLPVGQWFDYRTHEARKRDQKWFYDQLFKEGKYQLPLYARAGAIIPFAAIPEESVDAFSRKQGETRATEDVNIKVFPSKEKTQFTLFDDDGLTNAYQQGSVRTTLVSQQQLASKQQHITIHAAEGSFKGAASKRDIKIIIATSKELDELIVNQLVIGTGDQKFSWRKVDPNTLEITLADTSVYDDYELVIKTK